MGSLRTLKKFLYSFLALFNIILLGAIGYWLIGGKEYSFLDCVYMTIITISTIGYGEIIDLSNNPAGRVFTIFIALSGMGILFYIITNFTAFIVEGELTDSFRRRKMEKLAKSLSGHYIICGAGRLGIIIADELYAVKKPYLIIDEDGDSTASALERLHNLVVIDGDATDDSTLLNAGIKEAKGLFAVTGDDNQNLVISITAKQLNPGLRLVTRCNEIKNMEKIKKAGADAVVSPNFIGGLRMASEMIRPSVVSFLDIMLRDKDKNLRVEEFSVPESFIGKPVSALNLKKYQHILLLAFKEEKDWIYNPSDDYIIKPQSTLILMTTPEDRDELKKIFHLQ